jgi:hypothetical protein
MAGLIANQYHACRSGAAGEATIQQETQRTSMEKA